MSDTESITSDSSSDKSSISEKDLQHTNLELYGKKEQTEKLIETSEYAYKEFPQNWTFVYIEALLSLSTTQKYDRAIKILEKYLKKKYEKRSTVCISKFKFTCR